MNKKLLSLLILLPVLALIIFVSADLIGTSAGRKANDIPSRQLAAEAVMEGNDNPDTVYREFLKDERININTADAEALQRLPGIGEKLSVAIVSFREENGAFEIPEDIMKVKGIGETKYAALADLITTDTGAPDENTGG